jgi:branched-chain amino acid transport system ATP-binding protein
MDQPILAVEAVSKRFGGLVALDSVSFEIRPRQVLGLIGPNGAGKSVLINVVTGIYRANSGFIRFAGRDITNLPSHELGRLGIARSYQNIRLFRRMTVLENVLVASKRHLLRPFRSIFAGGRDRDISIARSMLERVNLTDKADYLASSLSYGEARRLEIARALSGEPRLLFLDEPAAGMNERETSELADVIRAARQAVDAIVIIEHDVGFIRDLSDRLLVMESGRTITEGNPLEVLADPRVIEAYLGVDDDEP